MSIYNVHWQIGISLENATYLFTNGRPLSRLCQTRENRWSGIMAITATYPGANGKNKTWMTSSPPYWNPKAHQRHSVKTGLALSKKSMKLIPFAVLSLSSRRRGCSGKMKILSFIEDPEVIKKILKHLGLWDIKARPPPKATATPPDFHIDYSLRGVGPYGPEADSQVPPSGQNHHMLRLFLP